jgi:hypothetical protein
MNYDQLKEKIKNSTRDDWLFNDERGIYTFKEDLNLRIQSKEIDSDTDKFSGEDWATKHPDPTAYRETYEVFYGSSFVYEKLLVSVDGYRATLPLPKINTNIVSREDYHFAEIVDQLDTLDEYMKRAGLELADE